MFAKPSMAVLFPLSFLPAAADDAIELAVLHTAAAELLTSRYGRGPWSSRTTEKGVLYSLRTSRVFVARQDTTIVGTLKLTKKKPWAINMSYFSNCRSPLYLLGMAVAPAWQRQGIGRWCLEQAKRIARAWPADAIRLDAYDAEAGAGPFYRSCGWTELGRTVYRKAPLIYFEFLLGESALIGSDHRLSL
jgi:GNAT superfamily N-acetyltransferase